MTARKPDKHPQLNPVQHAVWMHVLNMRQYANQHRVASKFDIEVTCHWIRRLMADAPPNRHKMLSDCLVQIIRESGVIQ